MAVRVDQSVVEMEISTDPNVRICQSVIELATLALPPTVACGSPPIGQVGTSYTTTFPASEGVEPYTFSISAGSLPPGISLDASTGVASGSPTLAGTFDFTVEVTDAQFHTATADCSIAITQPLLAAVGGGPPKIGCNKRANAYDFCLMDEVWRLKHIVIPPRCEFPQRFSAEGIPWDDTGSPLPPGAVPFNVFGSIPTPAAIAGDVLVCQGRVPTGYDAILTDIYQIFQGSGFEQGNGDIVWRIKRNQVWLPGLGNEPFSLGSPQNPIPLTEGQIIFSGTTFGYYVNVPNGSGGLIIAGSRVTCGMLGFYWPR